MTTQVLVDFDPTKQLSGIGFKGYSLTRTGEMIDASGIQLVVNDELKVSDLPLEEQREFTIGHPYTKWLIVTKRAINLHDGIIYITLSKSK